MPFSPTSKSLALIPHLVPLLRTDELCLRLTKDSPFCNLLIMCARATTVRGYKRKDLKGSQQKGHATIGSLCIMA